MNILITGIGGPTPRSISKVIRKNFPNYNIIGIDSNPRAIGFYIPRLLNKFLIAPKASDKNYWFFINNLIEKENIDLAFVQPEREVLVWGEYFKQHGRFPCKVLIPPIELSEVMVDKAKMSDILKGTRYIPKTININQNNPKFDQIEEEIGYPCWIRASIGSGGLGSLKLLNREMYKNWLLVNQHIYEFTVSEFLPGRHLANQMLYIDGKNISGASLECVDYVMANISPSKVTGNTSFGRFINENSILKFSDECIQYISSKTNTKPHGVFSFDLKEDKNGDLKVTEINVRHMAYTGIMAETGFDLITATINFLNNHIENIDLPLYFNFSKPYIFLRDVDIEPIVLKESELFN